MLQPSDFILLFLSSVLETLINFSKETLLGQNPQK